MNPKRVSSKIKQKQLQTKYLEQQTKKMEEKLSELKKQVEQQRQLKANNNFESTVTRWKKTTRSDAPLKSYAKQVLQQQKQAYKKFGIDEKKITGTKTFTSIKKKIIEQKQQEQQKDTTKIPSLMARTKSKEDQNQHNSKANMPVETIQNNFFKAKIDIKNLVHEKTVLQFLEQIFLQQYHALFQQNNITELSDLRFLTQEQLNEIGIPKGHQIKILKRVKEEFEKGKSPSKIPVIENFVEKEQKPVEKVAVEMGYGDGNVNDYAQIEAHQNVPNDLEQNFDEVHSQNVSEGEEEDVVLITVPLIQMALQTGNENHQCDEFLQSMAENCFNCYKKIPLKNELFQSPDHRNFCSANCLKVYKIQMQKTCPACSKDFFKTNGYYEEGLWFCSLGCCPNRDQIDEMFLEWAKDAK